MMIRIVAIVLPLLLGACGTGGQKPVEADLPDDAPRLIRVTQEPGGPPVFEEARVVGEIRGDTPAGRALIDELWKRHRASFPPERRTNLGPDASYTRIEMVRGDDRIIVGSWHTVEREAPHLFAGDSGLRALGNQTREQALAKEPASYRQFRDSFDAIVDTVAAFEKTRTR
jgi:hypothetical protein